MARSSLPPGFRFHPTDVELVKYYLKRKVMGKRFPFEAISELNIYKFSPWDLPEKACLPSKDREWFFFCPREKKYANGSRMSRTTETGYWKTTGKDRPVLYNGQNVGSIKTLVFHQGHAPHGERTDWVMHEYRIEDKDLADAGVVQDVYVLCKVFKKNGLGPQNGAQYGAPFKEEDWDHDEEDGLSPLLLPLPNNRSSSVITSTLVHGSVCGGSLSEAGPSNVMPNNESSSAITSVLVAESLNGGPLSEAGPSNPVASGDEAQQSDEDYLNSLLAMLVEESTLPSTENSDIVMLDSVANHGMTIEAVPSMDGNDIYNGLGDLNNWPELIEDRMDFSLNSNPDYALNPDFPANVAFLELKDLDCPLSYVTAEAGGSEGFLTDNLCGNLYPANTFGLTIPPSVPGGFNELANHFDAFQKDNGNDNDAGERARNRHYSV